MNTSRSLALAALALSAFGCSTPPDGTLYCSNEQSLRIEKFILVDTMTMCRADIAAQAVRSFGIWDAGMVKLLLDRTKSGYLLAPVVRNDLNDRSGPAVAQRDTVQLVGFNVRLENPDGSEIAHYFAPAGGGIIDPAGGRTAALIEAIPPSLASAIDPGPAAPSNGRQVLVHLQPVATRAGAYMYGGCTKYPVDVCHLCLTDATLTDPGCDPTTQTCKKEIVSCPPTGYTMDQINTGGCFLTQDTSITCCRQGNQILCGNDVPRKTGN